jgi:NaMN:DMB phosphoribosyltransferase
LLGRQLSGLGRVVLGESIPGGTTTAMAILVALGYDAWGRTSSAAPNNPKELKTAVVKEAVSRLKPPVDAVTAASEVGDPVHLALAAIALGVVAAGGEVLLAGGTQMAAAAALFKALGGDPGRLAVVTTRWIVEDSSADFLGLMREVGVGRVYHSKSSFADSRCRGLRAYEEGYVKEGMAMGYALWRAEAAGVDVLRRVEEEYVRVVGPCG